MTFTGNSSDILILLMQITDNGYDILLTSDYIQLLSCGKTKKKIFYQEPIDSQSRHWKLNLVSFSAVET